MIGLFKYHQQWRVHLPYFVWKKNDFRGKDPPPSTSLKSSLDIFISAHVQDQILTIKNRCRRKKKFKKSFIFIESKSIHKTSKIIDLDSKFEIYFCPLLLQSINKFDHHQFLFFSNRQLQIILFSISRNEKWMQFFCLFGFER